MRALRRLLGGAVGMGLSVLRFQKLRVLEIPCVDTYFFVASQWVVGVYCVLLANWPREIHVTVFC